MEMFGRDAEDAFRPKLFLRNRLKALAPQHLPTRSGGGG
jgi:hypothetical protein